MEAYYGVIKPLGVHGLFEIVGDPRLAKQKYRFLFRLWGVTINGKNLGAEARETKYQCKVFGTVESKRGDVRIVRCASKGVSDLSHHLLELDVAVPICMEISDELKVSNSCKPK